MRGHAGFVSANDGPRLAEHLARAIEVRFDYPAPPHAPGGDHGSDGEDLTATLA